MILPELGLIYSRLGLSGACSASAGGSLEGVVIHNTFQGQVAKYKFREILSLQIKYVKELQALLLISTHCGQEYHTFDRGL